MKKIFNGYPKISAPESFLKLQCLNTNLANKKTLKFILIKAREELYKFNNKRNLYGLQNLILKCLNCF